MPTKTTTPTKQKAAALAEVAGKKPAAKGKGKPAAKKPTRTPAKTFPDANGVDIKPGMTVKLKETGKVLGICAYRVLDGKAKAEGKILPRIGVELASTAAAQAHATTNGRTIKRRAFNAADLIAVVKP